MWRPPKYYKELRKRNKSDQAISQANSTRGLSDVRPGPGLEVEIIYHDLSSLKHQAASTKPQASSRKRLEDEK